MEGSRHRAKLRAPDGEACMLPAVTKVKDPGRAAEGSWSTTCMRALDNMSVRVMPTSCREGPAKRLMVHQWHHGRWGGDDLGRRENYLA